MKLEPYPGLTIENPNGETVNVHFVQRDRVLWGHYPSGESDNGMLWQDSRKNWANKFRRALLRGCSYYSLLYGDEAIFGKVGVRDGIE